MKTYLTSAVGIETEFGLFNPIFNAGEELPCNSLKLFIGSANKEYEYLSIKIYQGNNYISYFNLLIAELSINKTYSCCRGSPQISVVLEIDSNSIMTIIISNLSEKVIKKTSKKVSSSTSNETINRQLLNYEYIDIVKRMSYAQRLVNTNKNIICTVKNINSSIEDILDDMNHVIEKTENILTNYDNIKDLDCLLDKLSELSWKLNILSLKYQSVRG